MINEYEIVMNEFIAGHGSITTNVSEFAGNISHSVLLVLFAVAACSVLITFFRNIAK